MTIQERMAVIYSKTVLRAFMRFLLVFTVEINHSDNSYY